MMCFSGASGAGKDDAAALVERSAQVELHESVLESHLF